MDIQQALQAAKQFASANNLVVEALGHGLIHQTFKVTDPTNQNAFVLQAINTDVFRAPENLVHNYQQVHGWLRKKHSEISIPEPMYTKKGSLLWTDESRTTWRATVFMNNSYAPDTAATATDAFQVAFVFGSFTQALADLDIDQLKPVIPHFHDLGFRILQLQEAIGRADHNRLQKSTALIDALASRSQILQFFQSTQNNPRYPDRVMHHDCKISNILFDASSHSVICPVDLDTVMPGKFFSDLGDMIRSMACTVDENSTSFAEIEIRVEFYQAIQKGYLAGIGSLLTTEEQENIHFSGLIMIYMQSVRFLTDYLSGDIYYLTQYPEQNLNRAKNQSILLQKLESLLATAYTAR